MDTALMESTIGLYKTEVISRNPAAWTGANDVETATAGWVHRYNTDRLHTSIGMIPPDEHEAFYRVSNALPTG